MHLQLGHGPRLLVVEDVEETALLMRVMLETSGFCVVLARDEAEAIWRARSQPPDVILLNLGMRADRLLASAVRIRQQSSIDDGVPVVIFTGSTRPEWTEIKVTDNLYWTCPDDFDELRELLRRLAYRYWH